MLWDPGIRKMPLVVGAAKFSVAIKRIFGALLPCWTRYWAVARKHVGTARLLGAYSVGRYKRLDPQRRTSSCTSLSLSESFFNFNRRDRSLTLRLCFMFLSPLTLCVEEVLLRIFLENQLPDLPDALRWWAYNIPSACEGEWDVILTLDPS